MRNLENGSGHVEDKRKKEKRGRSGRCATYFWLGLVPTTTSAPASEVVDVTLALAPVQRMKSPQGRIP